MFHRAIIALGTLLLSLSFLSACGPRDTDENVFLEQTKAIDKAHEVENTLMDAQKKRREAEEAQTGQ